MCSNNTPLNEKAQLGRDALSELFKEFGGIGAIATIRIVSSEKCVIIVSFNTGEQDDAGFLSREDFDNMVSYLNECSTLTDPIKCVFTLPYTETYK